MQTAAVAGAAHDFCKSAPVSWSARAVDDAAARGLSEAERFLQVTAAAAGQRYEIAVEEATGEAADGVARAV